MVDQSTVDIAALQAEIKQLRTDFAKLTATIRELAAQGVADAEEKVAASADMVWSEAKRHARNVGHEIEERPLTSALTALATGLILGLILSGRRG